MSSLSSVTGSAMVAPGEAGRRGDVEATTTMDAATCGLASGGTVKVSSNLSSMSAECQWEMATMSCSICTLRGESGETLGGDNGRRH